MKATSKLSDKDDKMAATAINPGNLVHVAWDDDGPGSRDIFYKRDGADFDPSTINLSNNIGLGVGAQIATQGNTLYVVWQDNELGDNEIFFKRSTDGGATFGPTINLSDNVGESMLPSVAVSGNNVHVVWMDDSDSGINDIFYRRSTDGGASFVEPAKNISDNVGDSDSPAIAVSASTVHVVWQDNTPGNSDIFYRRSTNNGAAFHPIKNLSSNTGDSQVPAIAAIGNSVHVVWPDNTSGNFDILYRRSIDDGTSFPNVIKNLSSNSGDSFSPALDALGNNVHVVWDDNTPGNNDILYRRSLDGGNTFPNIIKNLSSNSGFSFGPSISVLGSNVYTVWSDNSSGNSEILYRTSANNGDTFPPVLTNLSTNEGISQAPTIAVS